MLFLPCNAARQCRAGDFFTDEVRYHLYLLMQEGVERFAHRIHAFFCMSNHIHLVIQVGDIRLSRIMQNLSFRYTQWMNKRRCRTGHVFQGRYKAILVDADAYLLELIRYLARKYFVCKRYGLTEADLAMKGQRRRPTEARAIIGWAARQDGITLSEVTKRFGRDVATLSISVRRLQDRTGRDEAFASRLRSIFDECQDVKATL